MKRQFRTGKRGAILCHECDEREKRSFVEGHKGSGFRQRGDIYAQGVRERERER